MAQSSPDRWTGAIEDDIIGGAVAYGNRHHCSIFRVPRNIRDVSQADYEPQLIHLGLYSPEGYSEGTWSSMEKLKQEIASAIVQVLRTQGEKRYKEWKGIDEKLVAKFIWYELCDRLIPDGSVPDYGEGKFESTPIWKIKPTCDNVDKLRDLCKLYDDATETTPSHMRLMLILDAMFLIGFLSFYRPMPIEFESFEEDRRNPFLDILLQPGMYSKLSTITADMWLFENQVPMSLLWDVLEAVYSAYGENNVATKTVDSALQALIEQALINMCHLIPGSSNNPSVLGVWIETIRFAECKHLLECMYKVIQYREPNLCQPITACLQSPAVTSDIERCSRSAEGTVIELEVPQKEFIARSDYVRELGEQQPNTKEVEITVDEDAQSLASEIESKFEEIPHSRPTATLWATLSFRRRNSGRTKDGIMGSLTTRPHVPSLPTVTNLRRSGIQVKGDRTPGCRVYLRESWRWNKPTLYISQLNVFDNTEMILRNLVAFELVNARDKQQLISYLTCMDDLIDTEEDVRLLKEGDNPVITYSSLGNDADVAHMFNNLLHNCTIYDNRDLQDIRRKVNLFYVQQGRRLYTEFVDTYFSKPWVVVSLLAAFILLALTTLQTVYTVVGYY